MIPKDKETATLYTVYKHDCVKSCCTITKLESDKWLVKVIVIWQFWFMQITSTISSAVTLGSLWSNRSYVANLFCEDSRNIRTAIQVTLSFITGDNRTAVSLSRSLARLAFKNTCGKWLLHKDYDSKTSSEDFEESKVIADAWENEGCKITCISVWNHLREWGGGVYSNDLSFSGRKDTFPASDGSTIWWCRSCLE